MNLFVYNAKEMKEKIKIEVLKVEFYEIDAGWLSYKITTKKQSFKDSFSHIYDPVPDLKYWLEAICIGVQQTSFQYNNEGMNIKFDFEKTYYFGKEILTIKDINEDGETFIEANVDKQQMVKAFYFGLLDFVNSDKLSPRQWEAEYFKERLCKMLKLSEKALIQVLLGFDRKELGKLFSNADPEYGEYDMPKGYNSWTMNKKQKFIIACANEAMPGYDGAKLNDFRSAIIEGYLEKE